MAGTLTIKLLRFRLIGPNAKPIAFAFIKAQLVPVLANARISNTVFPSTVETRTNQYGLAELKLYSNDVLASSSKYLITISYNGKSYKYLIRLERDMDDILDFEALLGRELLNTLGTTEAKNKEEGIYLMRGSKYYY